MAKTAVVNKKKKKKSGTKKRRRNYGAAAANPKKRRRRKNPGTPARRSSAAPRRRNPSMFDMDALMDVVPAATGGVWLGRWGVKLAGEFEPNSEGIPEPGLKHAFAILIAANMGGDMLGNMLGSAAKGEYARIACLGFGGDMFLRKRFMRDSAFVNENLSLEGIGYDDDYEYEDEMDDEGQYVNGFHPSSALGANTENMVIGPDGQLYELEGAHTGTQYPPNYNRIMENVGGFAATSSLGMSAAKPSQSSSFGYA